jgi:pimeloyl-ACP methyl ester carboxylesterase/DNA-binding CsgD family transcriptional regulator
MLLARRLKDREMDIIKLMSQGFSNNQIAKQLYLARETVRWYNKQIYSKLGVHNRTHAVTRAQELGLLEGLGEVAEPVMPPVQYAKSGDAYIAYQVIGDGPVDLFIMSGSMTHIEAAWEQSRFVWTLRRLASFARVIIMDMRGSGLSDRTAKSTDVEDSVNDICAVLNAVGSKQAVLMASCDGAPPICLAANRFASRVQGLILVNAMVMGARSPEFPWALPSHSYERIFENVQREWGGPYAMDFFVPDADNDFRQWWGKFLRLAASPGAALQSIQLMSEIDLSDVLPNLTVPTLVMHSRFNKVVRVDSGRYVAGQVKNSRYVEFPDNNHLWWFNADAYVDEIEAFIDKMLDEL